MIKAARAAGLSRDPVAAGRTDAGVHARQQVLVMRTVEALAPEEVAGRLNAQLPPEVGIALSRRAPHRFHPQWKAAGKQYRYRLALADLPAWAACSWRVSVDPEAALEVLRAAVGTRDYWAFHDKSSGRRPRTVREIGGRWCAPSIFEFTLTGEGFARYMVRYLVGGAVGVAAGAISRHDYLRALDAAVEFQGSRAPAQGLVLWEVSYPPDFDPFTAAERQLAPGLPRVPPF